MVFIGFCGQHFTIPDPRPLDSPEYTCPDPNDDADLELPDQAVSIHAFLTGFSKESDSDFSSLPQLLATLPDPSLIHCHAEVKAMSFTDAREQGLIPEASNETLWQEYSSILKKSNT